jgi:hypothetical protein
MLLNPATAFDAVACANSSRNDENIIHLEPFTMNILGQGILVTFLADKRLHIRECIDIVKINCSFTHERPDRIARVESLSREGWPRFGEGERYDLRVLDSDLNSFGQLANI